MPGPDTVCKILRKGLFNPVLAVIFDACPANRKKTRGTANLLKTQYHILLFSTSHSSLLLIRLYHFRYFSKLFLENQLSHQWAVTAQFCVQTCYPLRGILRFQWGPQRQTDYVFALNPTRRHEVFVYGGMTNLALGYFRVLPLLVSQVYFQVHLQNISYCSAKPVTKLGAIRGCLKTKPDGKYALFVFRMFFMC